MIRINGILILIHCFLALITGCSTVSQSGTYTSMYPEGQCELWIQGQHENPLLASNCQGLNIIRVSSGFSKYISKTKLFIRFGLDKETLLDGIKIIDYIGGSRAIRKARFCWDSPNYILVDKYGAKAHVEFQCQSHSVEVSRNEAGAISVEYLIF